MHVDPGAVPDQKTLALVNTYIIGVVRSLNDFSTACEQSLSTVGKRAGIPVQTSQLWASLHGCCRAALHERRALLSSDWRVLPAACMFNLHTHRLLCAGAHQLADGRGASGVTGGTACQRGASTSRKCSRKHSCSPASRGQPGWVVSGSISSCSGSR